MISDDGLPARVRALFEDLVHVGDLPDVGARERQGADEVLRGQAGSRAEGTQVRFTLGLTDARIIAVRYRVYGCPYTLATCEWLASRLSGAPLAGRSATALTSVVGQPTEWAAALQVPAARLGRLLIIEDALRAALLQRSATSDTPQ